ncbi:MAG: FixH family protein [Magnetococcales bacterium]|nr:FixH family protein [Magnetococcales bacterium]
MNEKEIDLEQKPARRFEPWPTAIVIFFLVVFSADAIMITLGMNSWPGLVNKNHYQHGINYNKVINAQNRQDKLGWTIKLNSNNLVAGKEGKIAVTLMGRENKAVEKAQVEGVLFRPVGEGSDLVFLLKEEKPGLYSAMIAPPKKGIWDVKIRATKTSSVDFRYIERITVQQNTTEEK